MPTFKRQLKSYLFHIAYTYLLCVCSCVNPGGVKTGCHQANGNSSTAS